MPAAASQPLPGAAHCTAIHQRQRQLFTGPFLLCVHVVGLATFAGLLTVVDLRLLGWFPAMPYAGLRAPLRLAWFGLVINAASGAALFASQATLFVHNTPFLI